MEPMRPFLKRWKRPTKALNKEGFLIFATQDWHPADHVSFYTQHKGKKPFELIDIDGRKQVLWPPHCVQGTENARIFVDNNLFLATVKKGKDKRYDSYSGFQDDGGAETELNKILKRNMVSKVVVYRHCHRLLRQGHRPGCRETGIQGDRCGRPLKRRGARYDQGGPQGNAGQGRCGHEGSGY